MCHLSYITYTCAIVCFPSFSSNTLADNLYEMKDYNIVVNFCISNSILAESLSESRHSGNTAEWVIK